MKRNKNMLRVLLCITLCAVFALPQMRADVFAGDRAGTEDALPGAGAFPAEDSLLQWPGETGPGEIITEDAQGTSMDGDVLPEGEEGAAEEGISLPGAPEEDTSAEDPFRDGDILPAEDAFEDGDILQEEGNDPFGDSDALQEEGNDPFGDGGILQEEGNDPSGDSDALQEEENNGSDDDDTDASQEEGNDPSGDGDSYDALQEEGTDPSGDGDALQEEENNGSGDDDTDASQEEGNDPSGDGGILQEEETGDPAEDPAEETLLPETMDQNEDNDIPEVTDPEESNELPEMADPEEENVIPEMADMAEEDPIQGTDLPVSSAASADLCPQPRELTYNGQAQELIDVEDITEGALCYSLDGETFRSEIPTGTDAGEYTVFFRAAADETAPASSLTVTIGKADVVYTIPALIE